MSHGKVTKVRWAIHEGCDGAPSLSRLTREAETLNAPIKHRHFSKTVHYKLPGSPVAISTGTTTVKGTIFGKHATVKVSDEQDLASYSPCIQAVLAEAKVARWDFQEIEDLGAFGRAVTGKASASAQGDGVEASFQGLFALVAPLGVIEHDAMVPSDDRLAAAAIPDTPTDAVVGPVDNADELIKEGTGTEVFDEAEMGRVRVPVLQIRDAPGSALTVHRATPVLLGDIEVSLSRNTVSLVRLLDLLAAVGANHEDVPAESKAAGSDRPGGPATIRVARKELRGP